MSEDDQKKDYLDEHLPYMLLMVRFTHGEIQLGSVDKPRPNTDASEQDETDEAGGELVISGGDAPLLLEMADEALNP